MILLTNSHHTPVALGGYGLTIVGERPICLALDNDTAGAQTQEHQTRMMSEIAKLLPANADRLGYLEPAAYDRTVAVLMSGKSDPVISRKPEGAWTHEVWDKASK